MMICPSPLILPTDNEREVAFSAALSRKSWMPPIFLTSEVKSRLRIAQLNTNRQFKGHVLLSLFPGELVTSAAFTIPTNPPCLLGVHMPSLFINHRFSIYSPAGRLSSERNRWRRVAAPTNDCRNEVVLSSEEETLIFMFCCGHLDHNLIKSKVKAWAATKEFIWWRWTNIAQFKGTSVDNRDSRGPLIWTSTFKEPLKI